MGSARRSGFAVAAVAVVAAAVAVAGAGCSGGSSAPPAVPSRPVSSPMSFPPSSPGSSESSSQPPSGVPSGRGGPLSWVITGAALNQLRAADPAGTVTRQFFDTPHAYVLTTRDRPVPDGWASTPVAGFTSYDTLRAAVEGGRLDPRVRAVLYDNESWAQTPAAEQRDPARFDRLAAQVAHRHHLLFVAAPAVDLVKTTAAADRYQAYLAAGLAGPAAEAADVFVIQAQGAEADPAAYARFVTAAAAQARRGNPAVVVLAGISTNPAGRPATAETMIAAVTAARPAVDGFWLNDPGPSPYCPTCAGPYPQVALAALTGLAGSVGRQ